MTTATCALFNARSLNNKLPDFHELLTRNYCMVFVTESWLRNNIVDGHLDNTDRFRIYRKDRSDRLGGGVLALVSKLYCSYEISVPEKFHEKGHYCYQADLCKKLIFDYEKSKEQQIILKSNLGAFYHYVNRKLHSSSGVVS